MLPRWPQGARAGFCPTGTTSSSFRWSSMRRWRECTFLLTVWRSMSTLRLEQIIQVNVEGHLSLIRPAAWIESPVVISTISSSSGNKNEHAARLLQLMCSLTLVCGARQGVSSLRYAMVFKGVAKHQPGLQILTRESARRVAYLPRDTHERERVIEDGVVYAFTDDLKYAGAPGSSCRAEGDKGGQCC